MHEHIEMLQMGLVMRKPTFWFRTWSDTNQAVQPHKIARDLKFQILEVEGLYYLCSENKALISFAVTAKLICVLVFAYAKIQFSHEAAHIEMLHYESNNYSFVPSTLRL